MEISIVIPVLDEIDSLRLLHEALHKALGDLTHPWEVVFVDDGSTDGGVKVLEELATADPDHTRVVELRRNFGKSAALSAGIDYAQGDIIIIMDADLQNDPADIPMMLAKIDEGYDVVSGWRVKRQDRFLNRIFPSRIANRLISWVTGVHLHDYGCALKAYRREVITGFRLYGEMHRFVPIYSHMMGARIIEVPVHHYPRKFGKTKYGLERTIKVILDLFTVKFLLKYSTKPMYVFGSSGIFLVASSFLILLFLVFYRIFQGAHMVRSPLLLMAVMLFILGFQSILMGLVAELLARTYHESQHKPTYTVRRVINQAVIPAKQ